MIRRLPYCDYLAIIKNNLLLNVSVIAQDIMHAEAIFGRDLGAIQGKTTRGRPNPVITDYVNASPDILTIHQNITMAADIMFVGGISFSLSTSRIIQFNTAEKNVW
jgi:hypothetical protein